MTNPASQAQARIFGSPGARLRGLGLLKSIGPIALILFCLGYLMRAAFPYPEIPPPLTSMLLLAAGVGIAAATNLARTRISNHTKGARGEELAARILATLPPDYAVFHGVTIKGGLRDLAGGADIDHVVAGPTALFVIETKHWHGNITIENDQLLQDNIHPDRDPMEQTQSAARRMRDFLARAVPSPPPVIPILLFTASPIPAQTSARPDHVILTDLAHVRETITQAGAGPNLSRATFNHILENLAKRVEP
jgi:hypothetical protein